MMILKSCCCHLYLRLNAPIKHMKTKYPNAIFIEDICESHGITDEHGKKEEDTERVLRLFYYGHHMTTIEGGMISTDNAELYQLET